MGYPINIEKKNAAATYSFAPVSKKDSIIVARKLRNMKVTQAKAYLQSLLDKKTNINGRHYTKSTEAILQTLIGAESNAKAQELSDSLIVKTVTTEKGPIRYRRKSLGKRQKGTLVRRMKICHIKVIVEDTDYKTKTVKKEEKTETKPVKETKPTVTSKPKEATSKEDEKK